jgi:hypothetical protein
MLEDLGTVFLGAGKSFKLGTAEGGERLITAENT